MNQLVSLGLTKAVEIEEAANAGMEAGAARLGFYYHHTEASTLIVELLLNCKGLFSEVSTLEDFPVEVVGMVSRRG
jgi:hypothetical protein